MRKTKSSKTASAIALGITLTLVLVLLGGLMASVITKTSPADWFNKELVATTEEEMNELLTEENIDKSVKYTGETVKKVELPYAVGDVLNEVYFDEDFDFCSFLNNLDWDNSTVSYREETGGTDIIILATTGDVEISDFTLEMFEEDEPQIIKENALLFAMRGWCEDGDYSYCCYSICSFMDEAYFSYEYENGELIKQDSLFPEGFNGGVIDDGKSFEITYLNPIMMQEDALFLGVEDGKYGTVETVFEKDQVYTIEKAEDGTLAYVIAE